MVSPEEAKQQRLAQLRRRMAAIPARGAEVATPLPAAFADGSPPDLSRQGIPRREILPVPAALADLLPAAGLVAGSVVEYSGASSLLLGVLAAVTAGGGRVAVVGLPRLGLLAAVEMGAHLPRLAVVPDPGADPVEIAAILLDGLDLVVIGLDRVVVPAGRTRVVAARARNSGAVLVVTGGSWGAVALRIDTRIAGYDGPGPGSGRLRTVRLDVSVRGRSTPPRTGRLELSPRAGRTEWVAVRQESQAESPAADHAAS